MAAGVVQGRRRHVLADLYDAECLIAMQLQQLNQAAQEPAEHLLCVRQRGDVRARHGVHRLREAQSGREVRRDGGGQIEVLRVATRVCRVETPKFAIWDEPMRVSERRREQRRIDNRRDVGKHAVRILKCRATFPAMRLQPVRLGDNETLHPVQTIEQQGRTAVAFVFAGEPLA